MRKLILVLLWGVMVEIEVLDEVLVEVLEILRWRWRNWGDLGARVLAWRRRGLWRASLLMKWKRRKRGNLQMKGIYRLGFLQRGWNLGGREGFSCKKKGVRCPSLGHLASHGKEREWVGLGEGWVGNEVAFVGIEEFCNYWKNVRNSSISEWSENFTKNQE